MPKIEIDGVSVDADAGTTIIEVADRLQIPIPRFCYHHKLSVAANCRMCLVQVEKAPKALPACATPITDGMKVWTKSKETVAAQQAVMEYLLINHPLDCPICDQGGECELQDVSMQYGRGESRFKEAKRVVLDHNIGSLVETEMTRCIQCTRCVRFGAEISGERELGAVGRGEHMEISTYIEQTIDSEISGNIIDLCPVGALTSKPFRYKARSWELTAKPGISAHDCIGANLFRHTLRNKIMRVVPKDKEELNEVWLSDRDRFSYEALYHAERLRKPMLKKHEWHSVEWNEALSSTVSIIQETLAMHRAEQIGVLVSPSVSNEEYFLLQKMMRALGCNNIDHRLRILDFTDQNSAPSYPNLGIDFRSIIDLDTLFLIGCNIAKEQPLASVRIRKMTKRAGKVYALNCVQYTYNFAAQQCVVPIAELITTLGAIVKAAAQLTKYTFSPDVAALLAKTEITAEAKQVAEALLTGTKKQIILGQIAVMHPYASQIWALANLLASIIQANCGAFSDGANAAGAWLIGCVPHRTLNDTKKTQIGLHAKDMLSTPLKTYILYGIEPEQDSILGTAALQTLRQAENIIAINCYQSDALLQLAKVILPLAAPGEYAGSMININGTIQSFAAAVEPLADSKPGWKILRMCGAMLGLPGFVYDTLEEVQNELQQNLRIDRPWPKWQEHTLTELTKMQNNVLIHVAPLALYAVDAVTRRATALQATKDAQLAPIITINTKMAKHLNVQHAEVVLVASQNSKTAIKLQVMIDDSIADHTAAIYQANLHTASLGEPYTRLEVRKC